MCCMESFLCVVESLVPNIVVELYFITQLLCVRSSPAQDQSLGILTVISYIELSTTYLCLFYQYHNVGE